MNDIADAFYKLKIYCETEHFKGWDPYAQTQFEIEGFIFIRLIARERFDAAVLPGAHVGVAQRCFQPREELH